MSDLDDLALAARSRELPRGAWGCSNCMKAIASPGDARQWNGYLVCAECFARLDRQQVVVERVNVPAAGPPAMPLMQPPPQPFYPPPQQPVQVFVTQVVQQPVPYIQRRRGSASAGLVLVGMILTLGSLPMLCLFLPLGLVMICVGVPLWIIGAVMDF